MMRRLAFLLITITLIYSLVAVVYSTQVIYKVKFNYAVILEQFGGKRQAITDVGWHFRLPFFYPAGTGSPSNEPEHVHRGGHGTH